MSQDTIESILQEKRLFQPPAEFSEKAHIKSLEEYQALYDKAKADPQAFWAELAAQELDWFQNWDTVLDWQPPFAKWFVNGKINISYNCLDRHLTTWRKNKAALIWEGEPGDSRTLTYAQLHREVCQMANVIKQLGVQKGDRVGIYMPMIPEAAIAMLACARIGAVHSVVFGGFSAEALRDRLNDGQAKLVITADGGFRKDAAVGLKEQVDKALANNVTPSVTNVIVVQRTKQQVHMEPGRDLWWHDLQKDASADCPAEPMDSEDMLFRTLHFRKYRQTQRSRPHHRWLQPLHPHDNQVDLRPPRYRCLLVHRRRRLDYRPQLHSLRPAFQRRDHHHVRRCAPRVQPRLFLGCNRKIRRHRFLHCTHCDQNIHENGRTLAECAQFVLFTIVRNRRRTDQSRSLDVVSARNWQLELSDRRYLVANRNRGNYDYRFARCNSYKTRFCNPTVPRNCG
jgi:hypothetical protein